MTDVRTDGLQQHVTSRICTQIVWVAMIRSWHLQTCKDTVLQQTVPASVNNKHHRQSECQSMPGRKDPRHCPIRTDSNPLAWKLPFRVLTSSAELHPACKCRHEQRHHHPLRAVSMTWMSMLATPSRACRPASGPPAGTATVCTVHQLPAVGRAAACTHYIHSKGSDSDLQVDAEQQHVWG